MATTPQTLTGLEWAHPLVQDWFVGRDIKILMRWEPVDDAPYREVILIIEARRGKAEESAYLGRYSLDG